MYTVIAAAVVYAASLAAVALGVALPAAAAPGQPVQLLPLGQPGLAIAIACAVASGMHLMAAAFGPSCVTPAGTWLVAIVARVRKMGWCLIDAASRTQPQARVDGVDDGDAAGHERPQLDPHQPDAIQAQWHAQGAAQSVTAAAAYRMPMAGATPTMVVVV